ncbi:MAG: TlpA family protein disulfide reductase [Planctomycetes bacterium]|nr:TlpA family protein disulfide reductase [Planctomycetota bacterium]
MPFLNQMYETYKGQGFEIIALSTEGKNVEAVTAFSKKAGIKYPIFMAELDLLEKYGIQYIPHHVFIDKKGTQRHEETGFSEAGKTAFETRIKELLKEGG